MTECTNPSIGAARKRSLHYTEWESEMFAAGWQRLGEYGRIIWRHSVSGKQITASQASIHWLDGTMPDSEVTNGLDKI